MFLPLVLVGMRDPAEALRPHSCQQLAASYLSLSELPCSHLGVGHLAWIPTASI